MNRSVLAFGIVVFGLNGCDTTSTSDSKITSIKPSLSHSQEETWKLLVGKWYGNQPTKDGGKKEEIAEKQPDGTYKITFRIHDPEKGLRES